MRCYLVDELQPEVIANLEAQLTKNGCQSGIERLYWLPLEKERLLPVQREHESSCGRIALHWRSLTMPSGLNSSSGLKGVCAANVYAISLRKRSAT